jgi:hypothetical protein
MSWKPAISLNEDRVTAISVNEVKVGYICLLCLLMRARSDLSGNEDKVIGIFENGVKVSYVC